MHLILAFIESTYGHCPKFISRTVGQAELLFTDEDLKIRAGKQLVWMLANTDNWNISLNNLYYSSEQYRMRFNCIGDHRKINQKNR